MHYNIALGAEKYMCFYHKKTIHYVDGMKWGYPNPSGTGMRFDFSSPLGIDKVMCKCMRVWCEDVEDKIPHLIAVPIISLTNI